MSREVFVGRVSASLFVCGATAEARAEAVRLWEAVAELLIDRGADEMGDCDDDVAWEVADSICDGWCVYYGEAAELARSLGLGDDAADAGLSMVLETMDSSGYRCQSLAGLTHAAWTEAVRSEVGAAVIAFYASLGLPEGWVGLGLGSDAAAIAARLWADGSSLKIWEVAESASLLAVA